MQIISIVNKKGGVAKTTIFDYPTTNAAIDYDNFIDEFLGGNIYG